MPEHVPIANSEEPLTGRCPLRQTADSCRLTVTATGKNGETVASETFAVALVGTVEVTSAVLSIKRLDPASTKQKEELEYPQQLQKPLHLQPGMQLKVCTIDASIALLTLLPWLSLVLPLSVRAGYSNPPEEAVEACRYPHVRVIVAGNRSCEKEEI